jgi:hypothetical protein
MIRFLIHLVLSAIASLAIFVVGLAVGYTTGMNYGGGAEWPRFIARFLLWPIFLPWFDQDPDIGQLFVECVACWTVVLTGVSLIIRRWRNDRVRKKA